jgi:serpin B
MASRRAWSPDRRRPSVVAAMTSVLAALVTMAACAPDAGRQVRADVPPTTATTRATTRDATAESLWALAADLERALARQEPQANTALAPVPIALGLAEAAAGAGGATLDQLDRALNAGPGFDAGLAEVWQVLPTRSGPREDPETGRKGRLSVELASTLWGQRDTTFTPTWLTTLAETWDTGIRVTDFRSDPEGARRAVNEWAASATNDHITQLLSRGAIDELTRFLATSATYLKAPWRTPFARGETRLSEFRRLDGSVVSVPTMRSRRLETRYATGDGWQAVELPYLGGELRMTVVVPDPGRFVEVEAVLDGRALVALLRSLRTSVVDVSIPQFGFTTDLELDDALRSIGVVDAFDRATADFAGVTADEPLALAGVAHQSFLGIDEEGTEATGTPPRAPPPTDPGTTIPSPTTGAAPTIPPATTTSATVEVVLVDRPFLVLVADGGTGSPLFYGRVVAPRD